jgi:ATP-dependent protease ClpP protease subunit
VTQAAAQQINIYGPITSMPWTSEEVSSKQVIDALTRANGEPVEVHINCFGGEVFEGLAIANALRSYKGKTVAVIDSVAASAATLVALGCESVRMHEDSLFMIHEAASLAMGTADDLDQQAALLRQINDILAGAYERKTKAGKEQIAKWMADETWFPAAQAKELGFADEVIPGRSKASAAAFGRFFAHYKRVPEALRIAAQPAAQVPTPAINALAKPSAANTPKRPPMDRKTLIATMAGCLALAQETAQAMADSSDSELADASRVFLSPEALPACSKALQPLAQKDGAEPTNLSEALRVFAAASTLLGGADGIVGKLDALKAKADTGGVSAEAARDARLAIIRAEAVKGLKLTPAKCDQYEASVRKGERSVEDYAAFVKAALPAAAGASPEQVEEGDPEAGVIEPEDDISDEIANAMNTYRHTPLKRGAR